MTNPDEDHVREAFIRLNSKGTPLRAADKVLARACKIKLRDKIENLKDRLRDVGFDSIENSTLTDTVVFCKGVTDVSESTKVRKIKELNLKTKEFEKDWKKIVGSAGKAIDHLAKNFGVTHANILPSKTMIPILSVFFFIIMATKFQRAFKQSK